MLNNVSHCHHGYRDTCSCKLYIYARSWKEWMSPFERLRKVPKDLDI
jgi:hypothetical protein